MKKFCTKQRGEGILILLLCVLVAIIDGGNITALLMFIIPCTYMIFNGDDVIYDDVEKNDEEEES